MLDGSLLFFPCQNFVNGSICEITCVCIYLFFTADGQKGGGGKITLPNNSSNMGMLLPPPPRNGRRGRASTRAQGDILCQHLGREKGFPLHVVPSQTFFLELIELDAGAGGRKNEEEKEEAFGFSETDPSRKILKRRRKAPKALLWLPRPQVFKQRRRAGRPGAGAVYVIKRG